jgi:hypothetical protein
MIVENLIVSCQSCRIEEATAAQVIRKIYGPDFENRAPDEEFFYEILDNLTPTSDVTYEILKKKVEGVWHKSVGLLSDLMGSKDRPELLLKIKQHIGLNY